MTLDQILIPFSVFLLSGILYFIRNFHSDFKDISNKLGDIGQKVEVISTELKGKIDMLDQRIDYVEKEQSKN